MLLPRVLGDSSPSQKGDVSQRLVKVTKVQIVTLAKVTITHFVAPEEVIAAKKDGTRYSYRAAAIHSILSETVPQLPFENSKLVIEVM